MFDGQHIPFFALSDQGVFFWKYIFHHGLHAVGMDDGWCCAGELRWIRNFCSLFLEQAFLMNKVEVDGG